eukprot:TRINITY_DN16657_c0_g1_i1.p1 TRINITY_DN16657_c0_g1~~TRINITY_DN16657_c0_g1_i1.p1  ORF type:complete len:306 (-),score=70.15 TRINITY_DN16657_c0_g1_i1:31-948(-)
MDKLIVGDILATKWEERRRNPITNLIILKESDTVESALKKLAGSKIIAAPVLLEGENKMFSTSSSAPPPAKIAKVAPKYAMVDLAAIALSVAEKDENLQAKLSAILPEAEQSLSTEEIEQATKCIKLLGDGLFHRLLVLRDEKPYQILTQMDVVWYFKKNYTLIPQISVKDIMKHNPISLQPGILTKDALKQCILNSISGAAVVGSDGKVEANFSVSDLRGIDVDELKRLLNVSISKFLQQTKGDLLKFPITVKENDDLAQVVRLMHQHHVHRVHVVDNGEKLLGIISITDVMKALLAQTKPANF